MIYSGKILSAVLKEKKISVTRLAKLLNVSRGTIYYWFKQDSIPADTINEIGYIIKYDFSVHIRNTYSNPFSIPKQLISKKISFETDMHYKEKYFMLLSKFLEFFIGDDNHMMLNKFEVKQLKDKIENFLDNELTMTGS